MSIWKFVLNDKSQRKHNKNYELNLESQIKIVRKLSKFSYPIWKDERKLIQLIIKFYISKASPEEFPVFAFNNIKNYELELIIE